MSVQIANRIGLPTHHELNKPKLSQEELYAQQMQWREEENKRRQQQMREEQLAKFDAATPLRYRNKSFPDFSVYATGNAKVYQEQYKQRLIRYSENFRQCLEKGINLVLSGEPGTGKTLSSLIVARRLISSGFQVKRYLFDELMQTLADEGKRHRYETLQRFGQFDLCIIDEVTLEGVLPSIKRLFFTLVNTRYENKKPSIIVTNDTPTQCQTTMGEKTWQRLCENGAVMRSDWPSYRLQGEY